MIVMLDTPQNLDECARQIGDLPVEQLLTPLTYRRPQHPEHRFAIDNGAFGNFDGDCFLRLLERERPRRDLCRFVAVPDVVAQAQRTAELFPIWAKRIGDWPLAYVCQDGQERVAIPWNDIQAIFIGGTTQWKLGADARACIKTAKMLDKWVHVGRINTAGRYEYFRDLKADSCDGTGLARYDLMRQKFDEGLHNPNLDFGDELTKITNP